MQKILAVTTDCSTRWNSTLDMLDRMVKLGLAIGAVLSDPTFRAHNHASTLDMTDGNWSLAQALIPILTPLKRITTLSSGQNYPSLSSIFWGFCSGSFVRGILSGRFCPSPSCHNTSVTTES